jgi:hypothetical protein
MESNATRQSGQSVRRVPPLTLEYLCDRRYSDPELADKVAQSVRDAGTEDAVIAGTRVLMTEQDAIDYFGGVSAEAARREQQRRH